MKCAEAEPVVTELGVIEAPLNIPEHATHVKKLYVPGKPLEHNTLFVVVVGMVIMGERRREMHKGKSRLRSNENHEFERPHSTIGPIHRRIGLFPFTSWIPDPLSYRM
jgi:hypothetical protein